MGRVIDLPLYLNVINRMDDVNDEQIAAATTALEVACDGYRSKFISVEAGRRDGGVWIRCGRRYRQRVAISQDGWMRNYGEEISIRMPSSVARYFVPSSIRLDGRTTDPILSLYSCAERRGSIERCDDPEVIKKIAAANGRIDASSTDSAAIAREFQEIELSAAIYIKSVEELADRIWKEVDGYFGGSTVVRNDAANFSSEPSDSIIRIVRSFERYRNKRASSDPIGSARIRRDRAIMMLRKISRLDIGMALFSKEHCRGEKLIRTEPCPDPARCTGISTVTYLKCDYGITREISRENLCDCK